MTTEDKIKAMMEEEHKIMDGYIDTAKTFTQLSVGALLLSITFLEKILDVKGKVPFSFWLFFAWVLWLLAALAGAFYQYRAVKWLENIAIKSKIIEGDRHVDDVIKIYPATVYGVILVCFFLGTISFAAFGAMKIL